MGGPALVAIGLGFEIVSGLIGASQAKKAGIAEQERYEFIAKEHERQAAGIMDQAHEDIVLQHEDVTGFAASQRAIMAASGTAGTQTGLEILSETARQAKLDEIGIAYNAGLKSYEATTQARLARMAGRSARAGANLQATGTLIGTAAHVADTWSRWKQTSGGGASSS